MPSILRGAALGFTTARMTLIYHTPLTREDLRAQNVPDSWPFGIADRVHYGDLDTNSHVNNAVYLKWFENIRVQYFQAWDILKFQAGEPRVVLKSLAVEYHKEMFMNEDYVVAARTASFRNTSFRQEYAVYSGDLRVTGQAVIVMLQPDAPEKMALPDALKQRFIQVDGATAG